MKQINKNRLAFLLFVVVFGLAAVSNHSVIYDSDTGKISIGVVGASPIELAKTTDLSAGNISTTGGLGATAQLQLDSLETSLTGRKVEVIPFMFHARSYEHVTGNETDLFFSFSSYHVSKNARLIGIDLIAAERGVRTSTIEIIGESQDGTTEYFDSGGITLTSGTTSITVNHLINDFSIFKAVIVSQLGTGTSDKGLFCNFIIEIDK